MGKAKGKNKKKAEGRGAVECQVEARAPAEKRGAEKSFLVYEAWERASAAACVLEYLSESVAIRAIPGTPYDGDTLLCAALDDIQEVVRLLDGATW